MGRITSGGGVPPQTLKVPCVAGIDQRYGSWDLSILAPYRKDKLCIPQMVFYGKAEDHGACYDAMKAYHVICAVGDCRPEAHAMSTLQRWCQKAKITFWRAQYLPTYGNVEMTANQKEWLLTLERTMTLENVYYAVSTCTGLALPQNYKDVCDGDFTKEMCNSTRVPLIIPSSGEQWSKWVGDRDHAFHSINYALIAFRLARLNLPKVESLLPVSGIVNSQFDDDGGDEAKLWADDGKRAFAGYDF